MDKHEVGILSCRIVSILLLAWHAPNILVFFGQYISFFSQGVTDTQEIIRLFSQIAPLICKIAIAIMLWIFARPIGYSMTADMKPAKDPKPIDSRGVMGIAFALSGLYIILSALTQLDIDLIYRMFIQNSAYLTKNQEARWTTGFIIFILRIVLGLYMLLKPYSIIDYLHRQQNRPFFNIPRDEDS